MRIQPVELLVYVDLLRQECDFLLEAAWIQWLLQIGNSGQQFLSQSVTNVGQPFANPGHPGFDGAQPFTNRGIHFIAFPAACGLQAGGRITK